MISSFVFGLAALFFLFIFIFQSNNGGLNKTFRVLAFVFALIFVMYFTNSIGVSNFNLN